MFRKITILIGICLSTLGIQCFAQIPSNRPHCGNAAFDQKVAHTISFSVPQMSVQTLHANPQQYIVLDARELDEYQVSHIPGAIYIGYNDLNETYIAKLPKKKPVVVYCSIGFRSEKIAEKLKKQGFTQVYNLYGSLFEWANQGYPLMNQEGVSTSKIHTYNRNWSRWVDRPGIEKVW